MSSARPAGGTPRSRPPRPGLLGAARAMGVDRVTGEVVSAMDAAGIPTILLKGPSIARWLYPGGGRTYCDTDLLVRASDHARAAGVLRGMGFSEALGGFHPFERGPTGEQAVSFVRPRPAGDVDLHRNLPGLPTPDELLWEEFDARSTTMPVGGRDVRVLDRTGVALHVVVHAVQQGFGQHTDEDLRRLLATPSAPDWPAVADLASRLGIADVLGQGLRRHAAGAVLADRLGLPQGVGAGSPYRWGLLDGPRGAGAVLRLRDASTWREKARSVRWATRWFPSWCQCSTGPGSSASAYRACWHRTTRRSRSSLSTTAPPTTRRTSPRASPGSACCEGPMRASAGAGTPASAPPPGRVAQP